MPSRSRHSRNHNTHSNRSSNKNRHRRDNQNTVPPHPNPTDKSINNNHQHHHHHNCKTHTNATTNNPNKPNNSNDEKSQQPLTINHHTLNKLLLSQREREMEEKTALSDIKQFETDILFQFKTGNLSIFELSVLLEKYAHRRNANALFLFNVITDFVIPSNLYLYELECTEKIRLSFFNVLFSLTTKISFKNVINSHAFSLSLIKILQCGLPTLSSSLMHCMAKQVRIQHSEQSVDVLRNIFIFLRPEIVEQAAELVQFNASIFEQVFKELIEALCDDYQPFRIWLFHRLCSNKRKLIEAQLAKFICFGGKKADNIRNRNASKDKIANSKRAKSLIINMDEEDNNENGMDLNRLMDAFKFCMDASNQLVINNQSRTYYELGHLILNDVISIASTLRYHFVDTMDENEFCRMIAIMHCNLGSIYLHENKFELALLSANKALQFDVNCIQSHRIRAEYGIKYKHDINVGLNALYQILAADEDHPYAINTKKEIIKVNKMQNNSFIAKEISNVNLNKSQSQSHGPSPSPREKHSAVCYKNDKLIIYGGCGMDNKCETPLNDLWIFDTNNNLWMQVDSIGITPCFRHSHCANIIQHKLYIIGGANTAEIYRLFANATEDGTAGVNNDHCGFGGKNAVKMHRFRTYKSSTNPKQRVFSLNSTSNNGVTLETVVTFNKESSRNNNKENRGYALGGWFTNFFKHENDEKIKELAAKGIIEDNSDSICMSSDEESEEEEIFAHYEMSSFPALEMFDLKQKKWIRPETTGTSPQNIMINHRSIVVGKKIFIFPTNYSFPYEFETDAVGEEEENNNNSNQRLKAVENGYVLHTDTLHWESFAIPATHKIILSPQVVPVVYDKRDKILFVSAFNKEYHIHCLLFTRNMQWTAMQKVPALHKLSGYNRLIHFAYTQCNNKYVVFHGGILNKQRQQNNSPKHVNLLCKLPRDTDAVNNVIDGSKKEEGEYSADGEDGDGALLRPLYGESDNGSRVSIVESLLFNKNPLEMHRIGPLKAHLGDMDVSVGEEENECVNNRLRRKVCYKTTTRTTTTLTSSNKYKTTRTRTITTTHHLNHKLLSKKERGNARNASGMDLDLLFNMKSSDLFKYGNKFSFLSQFEMFDFISMRWLPRTSIAFKNRVYDNHFVENRGNGKCDKREIDLLRSARINHTITMVGHNLCVFGGINSSKVLVIENFMKSTEKINKRFYKCNKHKHSYDGTNALSLTKYLFGISPNIFSNGSYRMVQCANCLILECNRFNFRTCSGCAQVQYCSKLCQKNHWKLNHRHFCTKNHIRYQ